MNYEVHITLEVSDIEDFIKDCKEMGVKPIIIETQNNDDFGIQVMTSSKYVNDNYKKTVNNLASQFSNKYTILRQKVEIQPEIEKNIDHIYYESHLRLKLVNNFNLNIVKELCNKYNFHFSKNLFKIDKDYIYQMITYREYNTTLNKFNIIIENMSQELKILNINCDKIEIEECIFDSNIHIDNNWLNK